MTSHDELRTLGLFEARAPRYTSYPPANHFADSVDSENVSKWIEAIPAGGRVSLYVHIPYCRRLCWFCACRTQGTATDRPLIPYMNNVYQELALIDQHLKADVEIAQIHLGGGTPTILPPDMLHDLGARLRAFRPLADDLEFSVEIDPTEVDEARITALRDIGMTRASIGVQDFDPTVQNAIGREQSYEQTRKVVNWLRAVGVNSLNMDILYGLPFQTRGRLVDSVQKVIDLQPDRVALYGYAHVPWMAKRQVMIPSDELPDAEARLDLFEAARKLFAWSGYAEIGIDHFAKSGDSMAIAAQNGTLRRNFQGYTVDPSDVLIGLGASAISRYPQGYAQNHSTSSRYATAVQEGALATVRGHEFSADDNLRADMIERLMCQFQVNLPDVAQAHDQPMDRLRSMVQPILHDFADWVMFENDVLTMTQEASLIARLVAQRLDAYAMPEGRHSRAL